MKLMKTFNLVAILVIFSVALNAQDLSFNMEMTSPKTKDVVVMKVVTSESKMAIVPQLPDGQGSMKIILDNAANKQYVLMEHGGQKMAMAVDAFESEKYAEKASKEPKITKTNEKRTIDGYSCTKIIAETDEVTSDIWLTQEAGLSYSDLYKIFNSRKGTPGADKALLSLKGVSGFPIEIVSKDKAKSEDVTIRIKDINRTKTDPKFFSIDGYKLMDMRKSGN